MPNNTPVIIVHGHVYKGRFNNVPCPMPGFENCVIGDSREGHPAYWMAGVLYLLLRRADPKDYPQGKVVG